MLLAACAAGEGSGGGAEGVQAGSSEAGEGSTGMLPGSGGGARGSPGGPPGAGGGEPGGATPPGEAGAPDTLTGVVGTFGAEPLVHTVLLLDDGRSIPLGTAGGDLRPDADPAGPLPELARLTGARVLVTGEADAFAAAPSPGFAVAGYALLEVEGERPLTGRLVRGEPGSGAGDRLEATGDPSRMVVGLPPGTPASGSRIWIVGSVRGDSIFVQSFGVLRHALP
jgi:hypothetical protein